MEKQSMRDIVKEGYNVGEYAEKFRTNHIFSELEHQFFNCLTGKLPKHANVIDLGCGTGIPYDKHLIDSGCLVSGVDCSTKHLSTAMENVPEARYTEGDLLSYTQEQNSGTIDAFIAMYSVFHIPKNEHKDLFLSIHKALKLNGLFLGTFGTPETQKLSKKFCGAPMMWSSHSVDEYHKLLMDCGFNILLAKQQSFEGDLENHYWMLLQKID